MSRSKMARTALSLATIVVGQALIASTPASAHTHPTPVELDTPAVVFVETSARVDISLLEHSNAPSAKAHIVLVQRRYTPVLAVGSGFGVTPNGAVVTGTETITPNIDRAKIYAVNMLFSERYGANAPMPRDPFSKHTVADLPGNPVNTRLQQCYHPNTAGETGGCVVAATPQVTVYPYVTDQERYGTLAAEVLRPSISREGITDTAGPVALLKVGASSMPTVRLAQSAKDAGRPVSMLGFTGVPSANHSAAKVDTHLDKSGKLQPENQGEFNRVTDGLRSGMGGGPIISTKGEVIGFFMPTLSRTGQTGSVPALIDASVIRSRLKSAGLTPQQGPVDFAYEAASHNFKNNLFTASIPKLKETLQLYRGHLPADQDLRVAVARRNTKADVVQPRAKTGASRSSDGRLSWGWLTALIGGMSLLLVFVARAVHRRRISPPEGEAGLAASSIARPSARGEAFAASAAPLAAGPDGGLTSRRSTLGPVAAAPGSKAESARGGSWRSPMPVRSTPESPLFCTGCGRRREAEHRFCGGCGETL